MPFTGEAGRTEPTLDAPAVQACKFEVAPVLTDFDPRYNSNRLMFFERFYQPFLGRSQQIQEEPIYDK